MPPEKQPHTAGEQRERERQQPKAATAHPPIAAAAGCVGTTVCRTVLKTSHRAHPVGKQSLKALKSLGRTDPVQSGLAQRWLMNIWGDLGAPRTLHLNSRS
ncbi:hypothetical protein Anapl_11853 [Anas platyrhynchos]|uniref:Uncharacterized protein n=1 Tax=Anas platyrhynchos TaxID=8839 RepID=R0JN70_ANAPL|nr:hypothetical protein Anapl_11853 [Anas platyrhynchos]